MARAVLTSDRMLTLGSFTESAATAAREEALFDCLIAMTHKARPEAEAEARAG
jgi:hypothetical protein